MIVTKSGIKVCTYVHSAEGEKELCTLDEKTRERVATELKIMYMNALYRGKAEFFAKEKE